LVKDITNSTRQLIRKLLVLTQSLEPLPENAYITMRLFYHDHTPIDYEPPFFKAGSETLPLGIVPVQLGSVETAHHEIRLQVATKCKAGKEETMDVEMIPASQDMDLSQRADLQKSNSVATQLVVSPHKPTLQHEKVSELFDFHIPSSQPAAKVQSTGNDKVVEPNKDTAQRVRVACACKSESQIHLIQCNSCQLYSHFPCYGYTSSSDPR
jgi:meiosis-specific protein